MERKKQKMVDKPQEEVSKEVLHDVLSFDIKVYVPDKSALESMAAKVWETRYLLISVG